MIKTLFKDAWALYRKHMYVLLGVCILFSIPGTAVQKKLEVLSLPPAILGVIHGGTLVVGILTVISYVFVHFLLGQSVMGHDTSFGAIVRVAMSRMGLYMRVSLYATLKVMTGILLLIVPGILWGLHYYFSFLAITTESPQTNVLELSTKIMKRYLWPLLRLFLIILVIAVLLVILMVLFSPGGPLALFFSCLIQGVMVSFGIVLNYTIFKHYRDKMMAEDPPLESEAPYVTWKMVFTWAGALIGMLLVWLAVIELVTK